MNLEKLTNHPGGFDQGLTIRGLPLMMTHPGNIYFVDSTAGANGNPGTFKRPLASIDTAVGKCRASKGDIIIAKPGHVETVTAAGGLDLDVAGIALIGLGSGASRPRINFTTAVGADMDVDAADITMANFLFTGGIDALTGPIDVNAADFSLYNCEYRDVTGQATDVLVTDANADRITIDGWMHRGDAAAGSASSIVLVGCDHPIIRNFWIDGNFSAGAIECRTTAVPNLTIDGGRGSYIRTRNAADLCIRDQVTGSTGAIWGPLYLSLADNAANITEAITGATFRLFGNIVVANADAEIGLLINWTAAADA